LPEAAITKEERTIAQNKLKKNKTKQEVAKFVDVK